MTKKDYKDRYDELWDVFCQLRADYQRALVDIGELKAENEILKGILKRYNIKMPERYTDF